MRGGRGVLHPPCSSMQLKTHDPGLASQMPGPDRVSLTGVWGVPSRARVCLHMRARVCVSLMGIPF